MSLDEWLFMIFSWLLHTRQGGLTSPSLTPGPGGWCGEHSARAHRGSREGRDVEAKHLEPQYNRRGNTRSKIRPIKLKSGERFKRSFETIQWRCIESGWAGRTSHRALLPPLCHVQLGDTRQTTSPWESRLLICDPEGMPSTSGGGCVMRQSNTCHPHRDSRKNGNCGSSGLWKHRFKVLVTTLAITYL